MNSTTHFSTLARLAHAKGLFLPVLLLAAVAAHADPARSGPPRPALADLRVHQACNQTAETQLLSFDEAGACSRAFLRVKLAFVPGVTTDDFDRLPPRQKTVVNTVGYLRYLDWSKRQGARLAALAEPSDTQVIATAD